MMTYNDSRQKDADENRVMLNVAYMRLMDRYLLEHLQKHAVEGQIHVVYRQIADQLNCGRNTVYRSVNRLRDAGHLQITAGNNRVGYTYQINQ